MPATCSGPGVATQQEEEGKSVRTNATNSTWTQALIRPGTLHHERPQQQACRSFGALVIRSSWAGATLINASARTHQDQPLGSVRNSLKHHRAACCARSAASSILEVHAHDVLVGQRQCNGNEGIQVQRRPPVKLRKLRDEVSGQIERTYRPTQADKSLDGHNQTESKACQRCAGSCR